MTEDRHGLDLESVEKSFCNSVILDPSCFWSKEKFSFVQALHTRFEPTSMLIPSKIYDYLKSNDFVGYSKFMIDYWEAEETELRDAWETIHEKYRDMKIKPIPTHLVFRQIYDELKQEYEEYDVLYDIIEASYLNSAFIISFGHSWPPWVKKIYKKTVGKFRGAVQWAGGKIMDLHRWKNEKIAPAIEPHRELFTEAGGVVGRIILATSGAPIIDNIPDNLPLTPDQISEGSTDLLGELIIVLIEN